MKQMKFSGNVRLVDGKYVLTEWSDWGYSPSQSCIKQGKDDPPIKIDNLLCKLENKRVILIITEMF